MRGEVLFGRLATGVGQGRQFTRLDWARAQFMEKLGIDPYPGTANVAIDDPDALLVWVRLRRTPGIPIDNPNDGPHDCDARCYPVFIEEMIDGAIVLPEVEGYPTAQVEIIAAVAVRSTLGIQDGDAVKLIIK